ncbi:MAG: hypothetical protein DI536_23025 [Archangium gephyra]|uniref:Alpha/beta hydrolase n=1 Tax=Archangium gephyra TaxID=48 RepID=A0A2W5T009_9BACT|nr:MAG: hypothetical protein DI536_23025 [Archangium gephyra]
MAAALGYAASMFRSSLMFAVLSFVACGSRPGPEDSGTQLPVDAGETLDASVDAGEASDAGPENDAGIGHDAGIPDAGGLDAGVTDAGISSSRGDGGITCMSSVSFDGHSACLSSVNGTSFKVTLPNGGGGPYTLGIYLHGDGAGAYNSNSAVRRMLTLADAKHVLQIAVLAPNKCSWWQAPTAQFDGSCMNVGAPVPDTNAENAHKLAEVIDAVRAAYDIRNEQYLYYSASGGSIFLTRRFIPIYGEAYPGGMSINCGGEMPDDTDFAWAISDPAARGSTKMFFTYGDQDYLAADSHDTATGYATKGFVVDEKILPGVGHCGPGFDAHGRALEVWTQVLAP